MAHIVNRLIAKIKLRQDYIETFSTPHGQRVLADILARAGVTVPRFNSDPAITQFYEGHRHLAMSIFRQVHSSLDHLPELMAEQIKVMEETQKENKA